MASESTEDLLQITSQPEAVVNTCDQQELATSFFTRILQKLRLFKDKHMATSQSVDDDSVMSKILKQLGFYRDKEDKAFLQNVDDILTLVYAIVSLLQDPHLHLALSPTNHHNSNLPMQIRELPTVPLSDCLTRCMTRSTITGLPPLRT